MSKILILLTYVVIESYDCVANMCIKIIWRDLPADKYVHLKLEDLSAQPQLQPATYSDKSREAAHLAVIVDHSVAYNITSEQKNNETALVNIDIDAKYSNCLKILGKIF